MKQHEREYFVSRIRSGKYYIKYKNINLQVLTPTVDDLYFIEKKYHDTYNECLFDGIKTDEQVEEWMIQKNLWSSEKDKKIEGIKNDIEKVKVQMYENRFNETMLIQGRQVLRAGENQLSELSKERSKFFRNSCEGVALGARVGEYMKRCTFFGSEPYDFSTAPIELLSNLYYSMLVKDRDCRELARTDPWRSIWLMKDHIKLFANDDRELSHDQKNIVVWSGMYDNIQESMDCPSQDVIDDDDLLDGWFIVQKRKRDEEKSKSEVDNMSPNVSRHQEVFLPAKNKKEAEKINNLNSITGKVVKKQREIVIKNKGRAGQLDFKDEKIKLRNQAVQGARQARRR
jgi:hypothetical protein